MKHLLLFLLFSGSLDSFSQVSVTTLPGTGVLMPIIRDVAKPDTIRATLIVYYDNGPAILHTKPGFVVRGEREIYLDDKKKVIKAPWEVWSYKIKK